MDAPKSKRFKELRRQNGEVTAEAVKASMTSRRRGLLSRIFNFGGKQYEVTTVHETSVQPATAPASK